MPEPTEREHTEPKCPKHPDAKVLVANSFSGEWAQYVCVVCAQPLGKTAPAPSIVETFDIARPPTERQEPPK